MKEQLCAWCGRSLEFSPDRFFCCEECQRLWRNRVLKEWQGHSRSHIREMQHRREES